MAIARAVAGHLDEMLADEPSGNLDSRSGQQIIDLLAVLARDGTPEIDEAAGAAVGAAATAGYAISSRQPTVVPAWGVLAGLGVALGAGALAGLYPAIRAARLAPAEALRAS